MSISIEVRKDEAFKMIARIRPSLALATESEAKKWTEAVLRKARSAATPHPGQDTGEIGQSIKSTLLGNGTSFYARLYSRDEGAVALNYGRGPGQPMPPLSEIEEWAYRHGIDVKYGWIIAKRISERGTKGIHFIEQAHAYAEAILPRYAISIAASTIARVGRR